ncbi:MAG: aldo/keto reductase [Cyclobacteriaceae bacterium]|nr:aldo/keto reductase [Cyclobacteriaceae bacterium]
MEYRTIGQTDFKLPAITFGAWAAGGWMWGGNDRQEAVQAIRASFDAGVTAIDTAPIYGQGLSEEITGEAIRGIPRDKVQVLTKFGLRWDLAKGDFYFNSKDNAGKDIAIYKYSSKESIVQECENSLRRLGTDYIDLYQIHWPDITTPISESMEAVDQLIKQGKVRYAGVCNYTTEQIIEAGKTLPIVSNQVPYSMVRRDIENDVVPYCIKNGKGILAYSPLQRGLLTGKMNPGHTFTEGDHRSGMYHFSQVNIERTNAFLQKIKPIADDKQATLGQLVLRWTINQPGITIALAGARNAAQALENARAADIQLSKEEVALITNELNKLELIK